MWSSFPGNTASVARLLVSKGASVDAVDKNENTALMWAAAHENVGVAEVLIEHHANVNAKNDAGATPLM